VVTWVVSLLTPAPSEEIQAEVRKLRVQRISRDRTIA